MVSANQQRKPLQGKSPLGKHKAFPIYDNFCKGTRAGFQVDLILKIFYSKGRRLTLIDAYREFREKSHELPNSRDESVISLIDSIHQAHISIAENFESEMQTIQSRIKDLEEQASNDLQQYLGLR